MFLRSKSTDRIFTSAVNSQMSVITAREGDLLCRMWIPIGEGVFELAAELERRGYAAFLPALRFEEQFCEGAAEQDLWRRCIVGRAMQRLGRPGPLNEDFGKPTSFYHSAEADARLFLAEVLERSDIYLLALAVRHEARFVTVDTGIPLAAVRKATAQNLVVL
jgi:hypothetical protein